MDPDEIFKRFFGTSLPDQPFRPVMDEDGSRGCGESHRRTGSDLFTDLHVHIQQQLGEMQKQMLEDFHIFKILSQTPKDVPSLPGVGSEGDSQAGSSARDHMLKKEEGSVRPPQSSERPSHRSFRGFFSPWMEGFNSTPELKRIPPEERKDCDIDHAKPDKDEIVDLYSRTRDTPARDSPVRDSQPRDPFSYFFGGGSSMSVQTVVGADGVVEERRTVKDSDGREETTVTRRIGDQSHTVTTIKDEKGQEEKREIFQNIDKDKMLEFDKRWQGSGQSADPLVTDPHTALKPSHPAGALSDSRGFFRKLFGF